MDDWRLTNQASWLTGATFRRKPYRAWSERWEHDHCAFCWAKFADESAAIPDALSEGWAVVAWGPRRRDDYHWVCPTCFEDFRDRFGWQVIP